MKNRNNNDLVKPITANNNGVIMEFANKSSQESQANKEEIPTKIFLRNCTIYNAYMTKYILKINEIQDMLYSNGSISKPNKTEVIIVSGYQKSDDDTILFPRGINIQMHNGYDRLLIDQSSLDEITNSIKRLRNEMLIKCKDMTNDSVTFENVFEDFSYSITNYKFIRGIVIAIIIEAIKLLDILRQGSDLMPEDIDFKKYKQEILSILEIKDNKTIIYGLD